MLTTIADVDMVCGCILLELELLERDLAGCCSGAAEGRRPHRYREAEQRQQQDWKERQRKQKWA
jgi:hypothetical protein